MAGKAIERYAKSLLQLAQDMGELDSVYGDMLAFKEALQKEPQLGKTLASPVIPSDKKLAILTSLYGERFSKAVLTFFELVSRRNREDILGPVAKEFVSQYLSLKGYAEGTVFSAIALDDALRAEVTRLAEQMSGKNVQLAERVDPTLIGGFKIRVADKEIDQTVAARFERVRRNLKDETYTVKL